MYATIDIGTNSILLLIGDVLHDGQIRLRANEARINRLGEGIDKTEKLSPLAILRTVEVLKEYRQLCKKFEVSKESLESPKKSLKQAKKI